MKPEPATEEEKKSSKSQRHQIAPLTPTHESMRWSQRPATSKLELSIPGINEDETHSFCAHLYKLL